MATISANSPGWGDRKGTEASLLAPSVTLPPQTCVFPNASRLMGRKLLYIWSFRPINLTWGGKARGTVTRRPFPARSAADAGPTSAGPGRTGIRGFRGGALAAGVLGVDDRRSQVGGVVGREAGGEAVGGRAHARLDDDGALAEDFRGAGVEDEFGGPAVFGVVVADRVALAADQVDGVGAERDAGHFGEGVESDGPQGRGGVRRAEQAEEAGDRLFGVVGLVDAVGRVAYPRDLVALDRVAEGFRPGRETGVVGEAEAGPQAAARGARHFDVIDAAMCFQDVRAVAL